MEYMNVGSWDKLIKRSANGKASEAVVAQVAITVLGGLQFLKENLKIIHRDIKPSNILANSKGELTHVNAFGYGRLTQLRAERHSTLWAQPNMARFRSGRICR